MLHDVLPPEKSKNRLTDDLEFMHELSVDDRYSFIRAIMASEEVEKLNRLKEANLDWAHSYYIRDFKPEGDIGFSVAEKPIVHASEKQAFLTLDQCKIVDLDTAKYQPYIKVNMSECSLLVARAENRVWMAHIGMSEHTQMEHALEQLESAGFDAKDLQVVASVGSTQEAANNSGYVSRLANVSDYETYGIDSKNIIPFRFSREVKGGNMYAQQLCEVVVGPDGMLVTTLDANIYWRHGILQEKRAEETAREHFVAPLNH